MIGLLLAATLSTFAGSGAAGIADGPAATASFLQPEGLAVAPNGDLYVADTAAQRIRRIAPNGFVTTIAGSGAIDESQMFVPGGFKNGAPSTARFNQPQAVAVGPGGILIVADRGNHCLREIAHGAVWTFAGRCRKSGNEDGSSVAARFAHPMSLAYDAAGTLYVADYGTGIRRVTPNGKTDTLRIREPYDKHAANVTGVSVYEGGGKKILFAATDDGVLYADLHDPQAAAYYEAGLPQNQNDANAKIEGWRYLGFPYAIVALSPDRFLYTDTTSNAVRFVSQYFVGEVAGAQSHNAEYSAGGYREGAPGESRLNQPMGLARRADGAFFVGDSGNRRIRLIRNVDFRHLPELGEIASDRKFYRIVYIGNSQVNYNQNRNESISGLLESKLAANWKSLGFPRPPRVYPVQLIAQLDAIQQYVDTYLTSGIADMVVFQLNSGEINDMLLPPVEEPASLVPLAHTWRPWVVQNVRSMARSLARSHVAFAVVVAPMSYEVSPSESGNYLNTLDSQPPLGNYWPLDTLYAGAVRAAGVDPIDVFPAFRAEELKRDHPALFGTNDAHVSVQGAALEANAIYEGLLARRPWITP